MSPLTLYLAHLAVLAYALVGGVFLAFSDFIMRSLAQTDGVDTMQAINREVFHWAFMVLFLGLAPYPCCSRPMARSASVTGREPLWCSPV